MIPWDELPLERMREVEAEKGDFDKVLARLKKMTLVVALGVRDEYLLAAVGSTTDCVGRLGSGKRLIDRARVQAPGQVRRPQAHLDRLREQGDEGPGHDE